MAQIINTKDLVIETKGPWKYDWFRENQITEKNWNDSNSPNIENLTIKLHLHSMQKQINDLERKKHNTKRGRKPILKIYNIQTMDKNMRIGL